MENGPGPLRGFEATQGGLKRNLISNQDHQRVLESCIDVPDQPPGFAFPLNRVGISEKTIWIKLPQGVVPFEGKVSVNLPGSCRGIHMSRIEGEIASLFPVSFNDIGDYVVKLAQNVLKTQQASVAYVDLKGSLPQINRTPATKIESVDTIQVMARATVQKNAKTLVIGAGINHITACPCTLAYNRVLFDQKGNMPLPTHTQRSTTWLLVEKQDHVPSFDDILACLQQSLHAIYDRLKRPDEAEVILAAHTTPQFAEDTVRQTLKSVLNNFGHFLPDKNEIIVDSHSLESIHHHNVLCRVETSMGEIKKHLPYS